MKDVIGIKGVLIFYIIIVLLTLFCSFRLNKLNIISKNTSEQQREIYCA